MNSRLSPASRPLCPDCLLAKSPKRIASYTSRFTNGKKRRSSFAVEAISSQHSAISINNRISSLTESPKRFTYWV